MAPLPSRRRFLRTAGAAVTTGLAGCAGRPDDHGRLSVTPAPVPTDRSSPTPAPRRTRTAPSPAALDFQVRVLSGFDAAGPARLAISLRNAGDALLTALDGPRHTVPFVDDDYVGTDWTGDPELLLVPDDAELTIDPERAAAGPVQSFLPESPSGGCWSVPFDWPAARGVGNAVLHAIPLQPGERRRHEYGVYPLEGCPAGTFSFENTFDLSVGDPPFDRDLVRVRLGFELALSAVMPPLVRVFDPVVAPATGSE